MDCFSGELFVLQCCAFWIIERASFGIFCCCACCSDVLFFFGKCFELFSLKFPVEFLSFLAIFLGVVLNFILHFFDFVFDCF